VEGVTEAMGVVVEMRDRHISGHQRRVTALAGAIADEMGLDEPTCSALRLAAAVHDIGTIAVPVEIIGRPARLTDVELGFVRVHPEVGREILQSISFDAPVAEIVGQHHERLDGSGYPAGLHDRQILIEARIIAVADVVEAMSSHRPWRAALPMRVALDEVRAGRGLLFDANVVDACLTVIEERAFEFRI
jgi:putative nucleotidyltransferase with HDIG domain